jgi:hypothetical protein
LCLDVAAPGSGATAIDSTPSSCESAALKKNTRLVYQQRSRILHPSQGAVRWPVCTGFMIFCLLVIDFWPRPKDLGVKLRGWMHSIC